MKQKLILGVLAALLCSVSSMAMFAVGPSWYDSQNPNCTYQLWDRALPGTSGLIPADEANNRFGTPQLYVSAATGELDLLIPNRPILDQEKLIQIIITWQPGPVLNPVLPGEPVLGVATSPAYQKLETTMDVIPGLWNTTVYNINLFPNPFQEWISIKGNIIIDSVAVYTKCVPEPATLAMLGLGCLAMLRVRKS